MSTERSSGELDLLIESYAQSFGGAVGSELRDTVKRLENDCETKFAGEKQDSLLRQLWLKLVEFSLKVENIDLSILVIAKLKLAQLVLLLKSTVEEPNNETNYYIAFSYIASYFHLDYPKKHILPLIKSCLDEDNLLDFYLDGGDWQRAFDFIDKNLVECQKGARRQVIFHKLAQNQEVDENFESALQNYKQSGDKLIHTTRTIIKFKTNLAYEELKSYCADCDALKEFWRDYSSLAQEKVGGGLSMLRNWQETLKLPEKMIKFIEDSQAEKWFDEKKIDLLIAMGSSLSANDRENLAQTASNFYQIGNFQKAASLYLCSGDLDSFIGMASKFMNKLNCIRLVDQFEDSVDILASHVVEYYCDNKNLRESSSAVMINSCLKLGLLDEAMQEFVQDKVIKSEQNLTLIIRTLEETLSDKQNKLNYVDGELKYSTILLIQTMLRTNRALATPVITIVILSTAISLFKLDTKQNQESSMIILERAFKNMTNLFDEYEFNASESLLRSASHLVEAIQEKLDVLSDNVVIREGFKQLIESTASRCLMEGRYKSAAKLYGQIEDNVNAVKCLMRTGDINVVIDYSLLVHDVAVTRITINYLKHSNAEPRVVEDFITKSKSYEF